MLCVALQQLQSAMKILSQNLVYLVRTILVFKSWLNLQTLRIPVVNRIVI